MSDAWAPPLRVTERAGICRLSLGDVAHGHGRTLQEAADALVSGVLRLVLCLRNGRLPTGVPSDPRVVAFLRELDELTARGEDIRPRLRG